MARRKVIIDTDPGVDDAMALFVALERHRRREIDVVAVTLVAGNTRVENQTRNVLRVFETVPECFGEIPIYVGAHEGLVHAFEQPDGIPPYHGRNGFCDVVFDREPADHPVNPVVREEHAVDAINRLVNAFPGEISLVTLGPLTNIALAMKLNKNLERNVKDLVIMGGNKDGVGNITTTAEFNFFADPEAAQVVFKRLEGLDRVKAKLVAWELCRDSYFPWEWRRNVLGKVPGDRIELMNILDSSLHQNTQFRDRWILCDVYATAVALEERCVKKSTKFLASVETEGRHTRGHLVLEKRFLSNSGGGQSPEVKCNVEVVEEVDREVVRQLILEAMAPEN